MFQSPIWATNGRETEKLGLAAPAFGISDIDYTTNRYWQASDGNVSIDLNGWGQGAVTQALNTAPGQTYQVTFDKSYNPDSSSERAMNVRAGGQSAFYTLPYDGHSHSNMNYKQQEWKFVADTATTELGFYGETGGSYGAVITQVASYSKRA